MRVFRFAEVSAIADFWFSDLLAMLAQCQALCALTKFRATVRPLNASFSFFLQPAPTMAVSGETLQERSKGKDVRTSNIVAAKVRVIFALELSGIRVCLGYLAICRPCRLL